MTSVVFLQSVTGFSLHFYTFKGVEFHGSDKGYIPAKIYMTQSYWVGPFRAVTFTAWNRLRNPPFGSRKFHAKDNLE